MLWRKESDRQNALYVDLLQAESIDRVLKDFKGTCELIRMSQGAAFRKSAAKSTSCREKGNKLFVEKQWAGAMERYNKAMCFAEEGSELMGLAYANRASCFFNMNMYRKCLIDIERAKQNSYPREKMDKLDQRKTICLSMMEEQTDQSDVYEPKMDYEPNEMLPCFANVLRIENSPEHGRHIVATEDIDVGKMVMTEQSYFAETIKQKYRRCAVCLKLAENLKPCDKCTIAMHCPKCEANTFHDIECGINPLFYGTVSFVSFRMVIIRSILLAMKAFDDADELVAFVEEMLSSNAVEVPESLSDAKSKYRAFFKLQPNPKQQPADRYFPDKIHFIHQLLHDVPEVAEFFHSHALKRFLLHLIGHHVIVIKNWIRNDRYNTGRKGIFGEDIEMFWEHRFSIAASYFNHSCAPNAYIYDQNGINVCVVVRLVRKGEQLCVTYDEKVLASPKVERQKDLQSKFHFQCNCDRCVNLQFEASSMKFNLAIEWDRDYKQLFDFDQEEFSKKFYYQNVLSWRAKQYGLLKKYAKTPLSH